MFEKWLRTEAALSVHPAPLLAVRNEENKKKRSRNWKNPDDSTSFRIDVKPFIRPFQPESVCRNVSLPGLGSVDCCQYILCVVNRRLHYARVVWVVNQYACFGRLQGNAEHLRKAAGLLLTEGSQKRPGLVLAEHFQRDGAHLAERSNALVFALLL